jgi:hypothetical protein
MQAFLGDLSPAVAYPIHLLTDLNTATPSSLSLCQNLRVPLLPLHDSVSPVQASGRRPVTGTSRARFEHSHVHQACDAGLSGQRRTGRVGRPAKTCSTGTRLAGDGFAVAMGLPLHG